MEVPEHPEQSRSPDPRSSIPDRPGVGDGDGDGVTVGSGDGVGDGVVPTGVGDGDGVGVAQFVLPEIFTSSMTQRSLSLLLETVTRTRTCVGLPGMFILMVL